jgi:hypothetical protein
MKEYRVLLSAHAVVSDAVMVKGETQEEAEEKALGMARNGECSWALDSDGKAQADDVEVDDVYEEGECEDDDEDAES